MPPNNLYAVNINVQKNKEPQIKRSEIKTVELMPKKSEIHRISSPKDEEQKPKSEIHRISSPKDDPKSPQDLQLNESIQDKQYDEFQLMPQRENSKTKGHRMSLVSIGTR